MENTPSKPVIAKKQVKHLKLFNKSSLFAPTKTKGGDLKSKIIVIEYNLGFLYV